jgi:ompA family protein
MKPIHINTLLMVLTIIATSCGADAYIKKGEKNLALGEYFDAANNFKQAYTRTPAKDKAARGHISTKLALCYDKMNASQKAVGAYQNVLRFGLADANTHLLLGRQLLKTGAYKAAETHFKVALDSLPGNKLASEGLLSAQQAAQAKSEGSHYIVKRMDAFNSHRADYSPMYFGDDHNKLYFSSTRNEAKGDALSGITGAKPADIFVTERDDKGKWSKPEPVQGGLNTEYDEGACTFSPDQRTMYFTQCTTDPNYPRYAQVMTSARSDAAWAKATKLDISKDTLSSFAHPAVSPDGQWLYFVSDMPGGQGGQDLWRIRLTTSGLGEMENLGEPINTAGNECFPTFRPNGDLYFSSDGHVGLGGLDVYVARQNTDQQWTIEHLGFPLNSNGDDFGLTFESPYNRGFFSSNRGDARGWDHIYAFEYPEIVQSIKGWVYEQDGYELPAAQVFMVGNDGTNLKLNVLADGSFKQVVKPGVEYVMLATCKGYLNHKEELAVKPSETSHEYVLQFPLASITAPVLIDNIFYDLDKYTLRPESKQALDELVKLLNENPNVTIELSAHCDYRGTPEYNKVLSQNRANAVVQYLIEAGIAPQRLTPVGYGKEKPKTIRKKLTERYKWLKEGNVLTEDFITKLDKDKQEICNQLNRRTEFVVQRTTYGLLDGKGNLKKQKQAPKQLEKDKEDVFDIME